VPNCLNVNGDENIVRYDDSAAVQDRVPTDPKVVPIDDRRRDEAGARHGSVVLVADPEWRLPLAEIFDVELNLP
jgi:hypothetical protein